jgi:hypothetical protein
MQIKTLQPFKISRNTSPEDTELLSQEAHLQQQHGETLKSYTLTNSKVQLCHTSNPCFNTKAMKMADGADGIQCGAVNNSGNYSPSKIQNCVKCVEHEF